MVKIGLSWELFGVLLLNAAVSIGMMVAAVHLGVYKNFEVYVREFDTFESFEDFHFSKVQYLRQHGKYGIINRSAFLKL